MAEASGFDYGDIARFYSPWVNITNTHCLGVWYMLYGRDIERLTIYRHYGSNVYKEIGKRYREGDHLHALWKQCL